MMPKGGEMHLRMPFLLIWQGKKIAIACQYCSLSLLPNLCQVRLMEEPAAYGKFGLVNLLELREECLREFQFVDAYISIKQRLASYMCACMHTCSHLSNILVSSA
jgi:hypothetical protein